jgi:hypothetical protein
MRYREWMSMEESDTEEKILMRWNISFKEWI